MIRLHALYHCTEIKYVLPAYRNVLWYASRAFGTGRQRLLNWITFVIWNIVYRYHRLPSPARYDNNPILLVLN